MEETAAALCREFPGNVNQRTQTHCLGVFILKAISIILKLSNKIKEATKNIFKKLCLIGDSEPKQ